MTCLEEGVLDLPPPVSGFHAQYVDDTKVTFSWDLPPKNSTDAEIDQYEVRIMLTPFVVSSSHHMVYYTTTTKILFYSGLLQGLDKRFERR